MELCFECKGKGSVNNEVCEKCDGEGISPLTSFVVGARSRRKEKDRIVLPENKAEVMK